MWKDFLWPKFWLLGFSERRRTLSRGWHAVPSGHSHLFQPQLSYIIIPRTETEQVISVCLSATSCFASHLITSPDFSFYPRHLLLPVSCRLYYLWLRSLGGWCTWKCQMDRLHHVLAYMGQLVLNSLILIPSCVFQSANTRVQACKAHCSYQLRCGYTVMLDSLWL